MIKKVVYSSAIILLTLFSCKKEDNSPENNSSQDNTNQEQTKTCSQTLNWSGKEWCASGNWSVDSLDRLIFDTDYEDGHLRLEEELPSEYTVEFDLELLEDSDSYGDYGVIVNASNTYNEFRGLPTVAHVLETSKSSAIYDGSEYTYYETLSFGGSKEWGGNGNLLLTNGSNKRSLRVEVTADSLKYYGNNELILDRSKEGTKAENCFYFFAEHLEVSKLIIDNFKLTF